MEEEEDELSSERHKTRAVFDVQNRFGLEFKGRQCFDCFFFANNENDANNLAIELHNLGYEVDMHENEEPGKYRWSITGTTMEIDSSEENIARWSEEMVKLAKAHRAEFDGWGGEAK